jgi:NTE family protein
MAKGKTTLVCGGGGVWGVAWLSGIVAGMAEAGLDLRVADCFIGTSAGSVTSAQLAKGMSPATMYERQSDPAKQPRELIAPPDGLAKVMQLMQQSWADDRERLRTVCDLAHQSKTVPLAERRAAIEERLGLADDRWPSDKELLLTAVDTESLTLKAFAAADHVSVVDAVTASCAIPAVWPVMPINGRYYVDGGLWKTFDNCQLAEGSSSVLVLSPMGLTVSDPGVLDDLDELRAKGARVELIAPDDASNATMAIGPLDPGCRQPASEAGRAQALREIKERPELRSLF